MKRIIKFKLNGEDVEVLAQDNITMVDFLRKELQLTGTKRGCEEGECGACTILLDGAAVDSCMMLAVEADGHEVVTIEGLQKDGVLHPLQREFIDKWALQCGFCTPGMIMSAVSLLSENPHPTEKEIRDAIAGNLCRCTGYTKIVEAIDAAAKVMAKEVHA
ncbi:(2Fe-2S)-binding protein [Anaerovorax odorimutans]|uniref:(2Fe-2S)-binding protein n=1 Tax=Anaerovorax odorimutans TaxID=109327 RepID=A0ABT1RPC3_9FIRM|nr:(2Fe-2S)-binding protein [Anaerovorax odorimutans]MCQ4637045.1 (2Fe-2S)-binding protein [Anaerovorax odorimutans]